MDRFKFLKSACLVVLVVISFTSCSNSDDEGSISNEGFFKASLNNKDYISTYKPTEALYGPGFWDSCDNLKELHSTSLPIIETSEFSIDSYLTYYGNEVDFTKYKSSNASTANLDFQSQECLVDFTLLLSYVDKKSKTDYYLKKTGNVNKVTDVKFVSGDNKESIYAVSGNYSVVFLKPNGTEIPVSGTYRIFVYVYK
ncbi:hypothetical protein [Flavobacterium sp. RSSB_23]|uniref:hypothetical protein n=1 Tax=Flavobacterium sp. RSSB_23 TaxID=3447668 RepID=UPI003F2C0190